MILYPRFLSLIIRHLLPNLPFDVSLPAHAQAPMHTRMFTDFAKVNVSKRTDVRPVTTPLLGANVQENYNPENDPIWINIRNGVDQIFSGGMQTLEANVHEPVVVQPQVDLQQLPVNTPEPEPLFRISLRQSQLLIGFFT
ncbi:hypothetical protein HanXRQr2_Chr03g0124921 [Helianthus annuus]|uniref:Uncharacterized protein n=1 Tax=Helianthus annuus TaxID=4232 RepID=A0A9K3JJ42_HELAN|nr:hypothetical protein HanXRQr2_Chr03g0124921 [Helianthus annuus]KAJ0602113.1 hypothetical protein HanIR_Chr03g0136101 [Helianthus annuus]